jgi:hypothetical protein
MLQTQAGLTDSKRARDREAQTDVLVLYHDVRAYAPVSALRKHTPGHRLGSVYFRGTTRAHLSKVSSRELLGARSQVVVRWAVERVDR